MIWRALPLLLAIAVVSVAAWAGPYGPDIWPDSVPAVDSAGTLTTDLDANDNLIWDSADELSLGTECADGSSIGAGDVCFGGETRLEGDIYIVGTIQNQIVVGTNNRIRMTNNFSLQPNNSFGQMAITTDDALGNAWVFGNNSFFGSDFDHPAQTDPTVFVHSDTDPDSDNAEWLSATHDKSNAVLDAGKGAVSIGSVGLLPAKVTADPCAGGGFPEGSIFYNDTSNYHCFCNAAGADIQMADNSTACF